MSFPSCIKVPLSKSNPEPGIDKGILKDSIAYEELITIANLVFGDGHWSHAITSQTVDFIEYVMGKYHIGCAAFVRVQLADGTFHEDMGYSSTESAVKGSAIESARSLSITIALKKALLCFGGIVEEKINENLANKANRTEHEYCKSPEEKIKQVPLKVHKVLQENSTKGTKSVESIVSFAEESLSCIKPTGKTINATSTPTRIKNSPAVETNGIPIVSDIEVIMTERNEDFNFVCDSPNKDSTSAAMTADEMRLERKRKQKQKQDEYKRLMKEKLLKADEKPNPRF